MQSRIAKFEKVSWEQFQDVTRRIHPYIYSLDELRQAYEELKLPTRATKGSAGYDFYFPYSAIGIPESDTVLIPTGVRVAMDPGYVLMLYPRSSYGIKYGMNFANTVPIIDSDFYNSKTEGHILIMASAKEGFNLYQGDRYMQGVFLPYGITADDEVTIAREGGLGSTGR